MATMHLAGVTKGYGDRPLLDDVSLRVSEGQRLCIVGRNGVGKTTLLRIVAGEITPDAGEVGIPRGWRVALHDQRPPRADGRTLGAYVAELLGDVEAIERRLAELEQAMADGDHADATMHAYAATQAAYDQAGGYTWRVHFESVLRGLGFDDADLERELRTFSGGELTRAALARTLSANPDLLLLDEPTNHLDLKNLDWLESELADFKGAVLVVSHDRWFLEAVATGVVELGRGRARSYAMRYSAYRKERILEETQAVEAFERQQEEIQRLERFIARFGAGTRARQAKSLGKRLDKIERLERPAREVRLAFGFPKTPKPSRDVIEARDLTLTAGDRVLFEHGSFVLERGRTMAVIGPNGSGKTTLVESLVGGRPAATGAVKLGHNVELAYFSQHADDLPERATVLEALSAGSDLGTSECRTLLGRFLFSGAEVEKKVEVLSGGERKRLLLARLVASGANVLVLDEPTNHLDVEACEALEAALDAYAGAILLVSHDRALIDALADETLSIEGGTLVRRDGDYEDFLAATDGGVREKTVKKAAPAAKPARRPKATPEMRRAKELAAEVSAKEDAIAQLEAELADASVRADHQLFAQTAKAHSQRQEELRLLMRDWEEAEAAAMRSANG
ncbi:MAG: ABC-F family ATP-binding cassette domain-containing protein [Actinobacteria bacterium]|nr:ABC-F family ATP-binding cassette domain-containing protein [Actinomycetota bacterium]